MTEVEDLGDGIFLVDGRVEVELLPAFEAPLESGAQEIILSGGSGSGKTHQVQLYSILKALDEPGVESLMVMETMAAVKKDMFEPMCRMLDKMRKPYRPLASVPMEVILDNGHVINFTSSKRSKGQQAVESQKSYTNVKRVVINEASALTEADDTQIMNRCGRTHEDRQVIRTLNPVSEDHWLVKRYILPHLQGRTPKGVLVHHSTYHDNPHLSKAYTDWLESKISSDPNFYRVYVQGLPGHLEGLVYLEWAEGCRAYNWRHMPLDDWPEKVLKAPPTAIGVDPGFNDPTAIIAYWDTPLERYAHEVVHSPGLTESMALTKLKMVLHDNQWPPRTTIVWDAARPDQIQAAKDVGLNARNSDKDIITGIDQVKVKPLLVSDESVETIKELRNYRWSEKNGNFLDKPVDSFNHSLDALRYAIVAMSSGPDPSRFRAVASR